MVMDFHTFIISYKITYLLNKLNAGCQVHTKVNELPFNSFFLVLFLLQYKHVMVEKLLQFLIGEVDTQLLQAVVLYGEKVTVRRTWCHCLCFFHHKTSKPLLCIAHLHQRFQIQRCPTHQWRIAWAAWCPASHWFWRPSTRTFSHRQTCREPSLSYEPTNLRVKVKECLHIMWTKH